MSKIIDLFTQQDYVYTRLFFQRGLGFIYFIGFLIAFFQAKPLIGENGLTPVRLFISKIKFWDSPSLFYYFPQDNFILTISFIGIVVSFLTMLGITEKHGYILSISSWAFLWISYLSIVNVGQTWYSYGWESMLLETGFLAIFLGPANVAPPTIVIWLIRLVCFKNMMGAGLIKIRGDECWKNLTCMFTYYETQPVPNPLSFLFHRLPDFIHKASVVFTFFIELIVPLGFLLPLWKICATAGALTILLHVIIIISGNLAWLNYLSIVLCISCFSDDFFIKVLKFKEITVQKMSLAHEYIVYILGAFILYKSVPPIMNLFSKRQAMNRSYDSLHLVNTYGAFGSITKERNELVIMGTMDDNPNTDNWKTYEFKGKPTDVNRLPTIMSPYEWKIDWQLWFAAFGDYRYAPWMLNFVSKLLQAQKDVLTLVKKDPFNGKAPKFIKVEYYRYEFQDAGKKGHWKRKHISQWLPPLDLKNKQFLDILDKQGWTVKE